MAAIYLIRHGQASFGKDNYDVLSPLGERQAYHLGTQLKSRCPEFDRVYLGDMHRHLQTADVCLKGMGIDCDYMEDSAWNEYDYLNILSQFDDRLASPSGINDVLKSEQDATASFETMFNQAILQWMNPDGDETYSESWLNFKSRVIGALQRVVDESGDAKNVAVFTSGGPIALLSQALMNVPEDQLMKLNWVLVNCGVSKIVAHRNRVFLSSLNDHSHFEGHPEIAITYR